MKYLYFEAFDEPWKAGYEGPQGAYWGIWDEDGGLKYDLQPSAPPSPPSYNGTGTPGISFTYVPPYGSSDNLQGNVSNVTTGSYRVAVYIYVGGYGWVTKPYWDSPLTYIRSDGTWACDITTGGSDDTATAIAAFLVPAAYSPPIASGTGSLPSELNDHAVASAQVTRTLP